MSGKEEINGSLAMILFEMLISQKIYHSGCPQFS